MNNYEKIYWLTRLENIETFFTVILTVGSIFIAGRAVMRFIIAIEGEDFKPLKWYKHLIFWPIYVSSILGLVLVPTQKEAIIIFAGGKTIDFIQSDSSIQKIPHQTTEIISKFMENEILEMNKEIEEKKEDNDKSN
jgi:hypothetical protein